MEFLDSLLGPRGLVFGLVLAVWALFTGKIRRADEVAERDKRIEVLTDELLAERKARIAEQHLRREAMAELVHGAHEEAPATSVQVRPGAHQAELLAGDELRDG